MKYLYILQQALIWSLTIFWAYQVVISFCSLIKLKDKPLKVNKNHKFMAIIPAHNEETVIKNLVDSLKMQDYPKELLDIYVIADNCDDRTAQIAEEAGAIVFKRFDETKKTKGYALNWFLGKKIEEKADYDAFCVFDADNIVDKDFIKNMNKKLCQGEVVVQGYRDIKNPTDSWICPHCCRPRQRRHRPVPRHRARQFPEMEALHPGYDRCRGCRLPLQSLRFDQGMAAWRFPAHRSGRDGTQPQPAELLCRGGASRLQSRAGGTGHRFLAG